jgi:hypothetical protein
VFCFCLSVVFEREQKGKPLSEGTWIWRRGRVFGIRLRGGGGWDGIDWVFDDELLFHFLFYFREAMVLWERFP